MKYVSLFRMALAAAGLALLAPQAATAREIKVTRDRDGDGHYNTKTYNVPNHRRGYYGGYPGGYYRGAYGYGAPYGYGYRRPYYGSRPYGYGYAPSVGFSYYSAPRTYYSSSYGSSYADGLAADVQRALKRRGYYGGPVDGDIGPGSRSAIRAYQIDRGLPVTGRVDRSLVRALGVG